MKSSLDKFQVVPQGLYNTQIPSWLFFRLRHRRALARSRPIGCYESIGLWARGGALGNLVGSSLGEVPVASWLKAARVGEVKALSAPAWFGTPFELGGFKGSDADFLA
jgi:hypothetical protein